MKYAFAVLLALLAVATSDDSTSVDDIRNKFFIFEKQLWKNVTNLESPTTILDLTRSFVALDEQLIEDETRHRPPHPPWDSWLIIEVMVKSMKINQIYKNFTKFLRSQSKHGVVPAPTQKWLDFAEGILMDPKSSVIKVVAELANLTEHGQVFHLTIQEQHSDFCNLQMSPHQIVFDLFNVVSYAEIKGYAMMQFSWMLLRMHGKGPFEQEASHARHSYGERSLRTAATVRSALGRARRGVYCCNGPFRRKGVNYEEVTKFLQGYVENEVDLNPDSSCSANCAYYTDTKQYGCLKDQLCEKQPLCKGRILNCNYVDSSMQICQSDKNSSRRYDWISYENGKTFGKVSSCSTGATKVEEDLAC